MIKGFSKLNKQEKRNWVYNKYLSNNLEELEIFSKYDLSDEKLQLLHQ